MTTLSPAIQRYRKTPKYKDISRNNRYLRTYGITLKDYIAILEQQHGVCKICHKPETSLNNKKEIRQLSVDHCHVTGHVRGLLCHSCNVLLGRAKDNIMILQNAIQYLEDAKGGVSSQR